MALVVGEDFLATFLGLYAVYLTVLEMAGFLRPKAVPACDPFCRLAVLIPAHDEEPVITPLLEALQHLDYPRHLYDVFVVADNCQDETAHVARAAGACVFERCGGRRGKGYALEYGWDQLRRRGHYDAVVVVDADNLVTADFLRRLNDHLVAGHEIVQCRKQSKNPVDNVVTKLKTIFVWASDRFLYAPKSRIGLSAVLLGSGMCISTAVLEHLGWRAFLLTEDFEFTAQALLAGFQVHWADETVIYEEQPADWGAALRQHVRWARGQDQVCFRYAPRLFAAGLRGGDRRLIEAAAQTAQSLVPVVGAVATVGGSMVWLATGHLVPWVPKPSPIWALLILFQTLLPLVGYWQHREVDPGPLAWLWLYPLMLGSLVAIATYALATVRHDRWEVTPHSRAMTVGEIHPLACAPSVPQEATAGAGTRTRGRSALAAGDADWPPNGE